MTHLGVGCELWVDGARVADGLTGSDHRAPLALDGLTVRWGRATTVDQPDPATLSATVLDRGAGSVRATALVKLGSTATVWAVKGADRRVVFAGRVTDTSVEWDNGGAALDLVAVDLLAELGNRYVGTEPWVAESLAARASRIAAAVGAFAVAVDTRPAAQPVSRMDVDRQTAADLLRDLATSGCAALWPQVSTAGVASLRIEDVFARQSMYTLILGGDGYYRPTANPNAGRPMNTAGIRRDTVRWQRATADLVTRLIVRWLDQSTSPGTTERAVGLTDTALEATYGSRGLSVGTILSTVDAANNAANLLMATHKETNAWRASGLEWDTDASPVADATTVTLALDLLDNVKRPGISIRLTPIPSWAPAGAESGLYVDGGRYRYTGGRWVLSFDTTSSLAGGTSLTFVQTNRAITYAKMAPGVRYIDLIGVGP